MNQLDFLSALPFSSKTSSSRAQVNATAQPDSPKRVTSIAEDANSLTTVQREIGRVSAYLFARSAADQINNAVEPHISSYWSSWSAPSPTKPIFFEGRSEAGLKTFEGLKIPRNSGANIGGNILEVSEIEKVAILVTPATIRTEVYTILSAY